ncbi:ATPase family gene 2 protein homolog B-like isoform X2 [Oratosquilla oratoria]|uniref:ATPase family gene 2 protein homolog B-like isoform X2 n=1 Tax=Oratosquilla oratoria TaxID=337810 RepID=UPI003F768418
MSKGVLLVGPPGCGKTSIVRQLCAEEEICLVAASGVDIVGPHHGETESNFRKIGNQAQSLSREGPCILFLDELDSLCSKKTADSQVHELQLTAQVLLVLDECSNCPNLFVIGATNRPYDLDTGVRRSGRFEIEILLNVPTATERASILSVHCQDLLRKDHPGLAKIAESTPGFVGADLEALVQNCKDSFQKQYGKICEENRDDFVNEMLHSLKTITPSINKSLTFLTAKPQLVPIGGLDQVKQQLHHIFSLHTKFSHSYQQFKIKPPRGILLYGPRGCGKTRLIGSLASQHSCTFLSANASQLLSPYVGETEKRIAALFHAARLAQPSVIFLDEIDGLFGVRDSTSGGVHVSLLNELLQAMDGADVNSVSLQGAALFKNQYSDYRHDAVLVCAATNAPDRIDAALLRPGRFDYHIYVPPPDFTARHHILQLKTKKMNLPNDSILDTLAQHTDGYTGAELENLVLQASILAVQMGNIDRETITLSEECLLEALQNTTPSVSKKEIKMYEMFS